MIEARYHTGLSLPFYSAVNYLVREEVYAYDLSYIHKATGRDQWEILYNYPQSGFGYSCWNPGNREVLGKAHVLYAFLNLPAYRINEKVSFNYQLSGGAAYTPKIFDPETNHLNRAIGSHMNVYFRLGADCRIKVSPHYNLIIEFGTTHFSNGKTMSPNLGINIASLSFGLNYLFKDPDKPVPDPPVTNPGKFPVQSLSFSAGSKTYDNLTGRRYLSSTASYNIERIIRLKTRIGLGADLFYDRSISEALADTEGNPENEFKMMMRAGLHASWAMRYKHAIMGFQAGHYIYSRHKVLTNIYNKLSFQYLLTENISLGVSVKSHWGKADCLEYGLTYYL